MSEQTIEVGDVVRYKPRPGWGRAIVREVANGQVRAERWAWRLWTVRGDVSEFEIVKKECERNDRRE